MQGEPRAGRSILGSGRARDLLAARVAELEVRLCFVR